MRRSVRSYMNRNFVTTSFLTFLIVNKMYYVTTLCIIKSFFIAIYSHFLTFINVSKTKFFIIEISLYLIISFVFICCK